MDKTLETDRPSQVATHLSVEEVPPTNTGNPARVGFWGIVVGLGGFLFWAAYAPLDEGVPVPGSVTIDTKRKSVQHLSGGIVNQILVKEGQFVKKSEPLVLLDQAQARASYESVRQQYLMLRSMEGRLTAEQKQSKSITFDPELVEAAAQDESIRNQIDVQTNLFNSRRNAMDADLQAIEESIKGTQSSIEEYEVMLQARMKQKRLLQKELDAVKELAVKGFVPRTKQTELERSMAGLVADIAEAEATVNRSEQALSELRMRAIQRRNDYNKEVASQLADVTRDVQTMRERYNAVKDDLARTVIRAPAEGQVMSLAVQTVGGVVQPGQKLMDIVPDREGMMLEMHIPPYLIDRIRPGNLADVRFASFAHSPQLVVKARIASVSLDLMNDQQGASYYLARAAVTPEGMNTLGKRQMHAGMPVDIVIKTGERSVLKYLLHPITKRMARSLTEE